MLASALSFVLLSLGLVSNACAEEPAVDIRDRVALDRFVIQAHRGGGESVPENTLETFKMAWDWGVVPEADIRISKDGVICCFHDKDILRLAKNAPADWKDREAGELTWDELQLLDVGSYRGKEFAGQKIPKLEDVFRFMSGHPQRWLYLDIKKVPLDKMAALVKKYGVVKQVIFTSTHHDLIREWKKIMPESQSLMWVGGSDKKLKAKFEKAAKNNFEGITSLQIHVRLEEPGSKYPFRPSPDFLREVGRQLRAHNITFQSLPWGSTDPKVYHALMDLGVESFASDHPRVTKKAVADYYEKKKNTTPSQKEPLE